ncbi:hypothetical protein BT69DRAFT_1277631 [Atractiella rhizophila]|nr:hypothetical protein BT69DRAFT_1277631 [Atractiella rhizophila]
MSPSEPLVTTTQNGSKAVPRTRAATVSTGEDASTYFGASISSISPTSSLRYSRSEGHPRRHFRSVDLMKATEQRPGDCWVVGDAVEKNHEGVDLDPSSPQAKGARLSLKRRSLADVDSNQHESKNQIKLEELMKSVGTLEKKMGKEKKQTN